MKKIIKKWWIGAIAIIVLTIAISVFMGGSSTEGVGTAGINNQEFRKIEVGKTTSYELNEIIDKKNEWNDEEVRNKCIEKVEEKKENGKDTYVYKYYGERGGYALITLQANSLNEEGNNNLIVTNKESFDLK